MIAGDFNNGPVDHSPMFAPLTEAAFTDARARALQYAALGGATLGRVLSIHEGGVVDHRPRPMMSRSADAFAGSMPVEGGTHAVTTSVTVRWELE